MSVKSLAAIIGALGVGMSGYAKGRGQFQENERQKTLAERDDKQFERTQAEWGRQDAARNAVKDAYADVQPEPVVGGGIPEEQAVVGYKAQNGQTYADQGGAQQAMLGLNSDYSRAKRAADNLAKLGETDQAEKYKAQMKSLIKEGTVEALDGIQRGRASAEDVKRAGGKVVRTLGKDVAERFNGIGEMRASADTMVEDFITKDAAGREIVNSRVVGKDGKPVVDDVQNAYRTMLSAKERFDLEDKQGALYQNGVKIANDDRHNVEVEKLTANRDKASAANDRAARSIAAAGIGLQRERLNMEKGQLKNQTVAGKLAEIEATMGKLTPEKRNEYAETLFGLTKGKKPDTTKMLDDMTATYQKGLIEGNPTAPPKQIAVAVAKYRKEQEEGFAGMQRNPTLESDVKKDMSKSKPGTPEYTQKWQEANQKLNFTEQQLAGMGFPRPGKATTVPNPMARTAAEVGARPASARSAPKAAPASDAIDVRKDPTLVSLNAAIASMNPNDPKNVQQLMQLGTAKNARLEQLQANYGSMATLIAE